MKRGLLLTSVLAYVSLIALTTAVVGDAKAPYWNTAYVTSYATFEFGGYGLTGCSGHVCYTASGEALDDDGFTVANNQLSFGTHVEFLNWDGKQLRRCRARVNDRTGSSYDFELSYALSLCVGAPSTCRCRTLTWSDRVSWRVVADPPCRVRGELPDPTCTPGVVLTTKASDVCTIGWASAHRHVTYEQRLVVFAHYGIPYDQHRDYELDHLISLELGGSNSIRNLWPELWSQAYQKDKVENRLHRQVCNGTTSLRSAQRRIAKDWRGL